MHEQPLTAAGLAGLIFRFIALGIIITAMLALGLHLLLLLDGVINSNDASMQPYKQTFMGIQIQTYDPVSIPLTGLLLYTLLMLLGILLWKLSPFIGFAMSRKLK